MGPLLGTPEGEGKDWLAGKFAELDDQFGQTPSDLCREIPGNGEACTFVHPNAQGADNQARQVQAAFQPLRTPAPAAGHS